MSEKIKKEIIDNKNSTCANLGPGREIKGNYEMPKVTVRRCSIDNLPCTGPFRTCQNNPNRQS